METGNRMERAIIGAPAFRRLLRFVPLLVLLSVCQTAVYAQLSDEAVLEYALEGRRNGKSEHQIGRELLARGVTAEQAERLKRKYEESQGSEVRVADRGISGQQRERVQSSSERLTAGSLDVVSSAATDPGGGSFGPARGLRARRVPEPHADLRAESRTRRRRRTTVWVRATRSSSTSGGRTSGASERRSPPRAISWSNRWVLCI